MSLKKVTTRKKTLKVTESNLATSSNPTDLSNIFPIAPDILTQIHKQIFHYIWPKKSRTHSKKNTPLPKNKGGINIKEPEVHNLAMRIKHPLNSKYKKDQLP